ncbi:uncharacterized protein [Watersipora subatra]|uniref:uncharacterized protein n=1 Tax=Watersipora subatra TaxID=2589382 RepID=UPI00355C5F77
MSLADADERASTARYEIIPENKRKKKTENPYMLLLKSASHLEDHPYASLVIDSYGDMLDDTYTLALEEENYQTTKREELYIHRIADLEIQMAEAELGNKPVTVSYVKNILEDLHQNTVMVIYEHLRSSDDDHEYAQLQPKHIKELFLNIKSTIGCSFSAEINTFTTVDEKLTWREQVFMMRIKELEETLSDLQQQLQPSNLHPNPEARIESDKEAINDSDKVEEQIQTLECSGEDNGSSSYVNAIKKDLSNFPWYVGMRSYKEATWMLYSEKHGLFFVREREKEPGKYAIGINCKGSACHIKIQEDIDFYTLDEHMYFRSIPKLVDYYQHHTLEENFPNVATTLSIPWKDRNAC